MTGHTRLRVFTDSDGCHGNPLTIVPDGDAFDDAAAQRFAAASGTSETVFIDDMERARLRIYVPRRRVPFAGHPLVGAAWFLARQGVDVHALHVDAGVVPAQAEDGWASLLAPVGASVPWVLVRKPSPDDVEAADPSGPDRHDYVWAWNDEAAGSVRARAFASSSGTVEDEATGGAAVQLCAELARPLTVVQGRGSLIEVAPQHGGVRLTGRVVFDV